MGCIYKRGNIYWIKYYRNGKPYQESTKSPKESDAKKLLKKREGEIIEGKMPGIVFDRVKFDVRWTPLSRQKIDLIKDDGPASRWMIQLRSSDQSLFLQHPFVRGLF